MKGSILTKTLSIKKRIAEVVVDLPLKKSLHYQIPFKFLHCVDIGKRVLVPLGKRKVSGIILNFLNQSPFPDLKEIIEVINEVPVLTRLDLNFFKFISYYYFANLSSALHLAYPKGRRSWYGNNHLSLPEVKKEKCFQINEEVSAEFDKKFLNKAPLQSKIFAYLKKQGTLTSKEIEKQFKNARSALKELEKKGLIISYYRDQPREHLPYPEITFELPPVLTLNQANAWLKIEEGIKKGGFCPYLLHGVTGSGKTEIYMKTIEEVLKHQKSAIVLVPEIALTPLVLERFCSRFGKKIALIHSRMNPGERLDELRRIKNGEVRIVIGTRSALFTPLKDLGAIIVDEEHDPSYKQEKGICYHARDLALVKGKIFKTIVILGSATPSIESFYNSQKGKFVYLKLTERVQQRPLPEVKIVDLRNKIQENKSLFSPELKEAIKQRLENREQVLLFLNRRGYATLILCPECGFRFICPNCSVSLVHHLSQKSLICHFCNYQTPTPKVCPRCNSLRITSIGWGTEKVERELKKLFPEARIARMDRDTTRQKLSYHYILHSFAKGEQDILVGTQMITKGHDLPGITLVGIILADSALSLPDFRASERTFQILTQVAGRTGRGDKKGEVIIQTFNPDHYSITAAATHNFFSFYKQEIRFRKELNYPPFTRIITFLLEGKEMETVKDYAFKLYQETHINLIKTGLKREVEILGPVQAPWSKLKGKYRYQIILKSKKIPQIHTLINTLLKNRSLSLSNKEVKWIIDVDPVHMM